MANELIPTAAVAPNQDSAGGPTNVGNRFAHTGDLQIDAIGYYRRTVGKTNVNRVDLWDAASGTNLVNAVPTPEQDDGTVGWHYVSIAPHTLGSGVEYVCSVSVVSGDGGAYWSTAPPALGAGYTQIGVRYNGSGNDTSHPPNVVSGAELYAVSVASGVPAAVGGGATSADVDADLAAWLSTVAGTNTHHADSAPYQTQQLASGATGFDAIKAVADAVAAAVSGLPGTIAGAVTTVTGQITAMTATVTGQLTTLAAALAGDVTDLSARILELYAGLLGGVPGALSGRTAFPTELWELVDEGDFDGDVAITVAADLYALSFDVGTSGLVATPVAGVNWYPRAGWWCLLNGTFAAERHYFDFANVHLTDQGRRMPGALIHCRAGCAGHWQAWSLT